MDKTNEQWTAEGDCHICRKNKYCTKPCKKRKILIENILKNVVSNNLENRFKFHK